MTRTALIIGASRGLGLGLAKEFHAQGWELTATVRNPAHADELRALPGVIVETLDITDPASREALAGRLAGRRFDLLYINAGISGPGHHQPAQATRDELGELFLTNAVAPIQTAEQLLPLVDPQTGVIVFMSSVMGSVELGPGMGMPLYGASKAALNHLARNFARGLEGTPLTVLLMHPGWVKTNMGGAEAPLDVQTSCRGLVDQVSQASGGGVRFVDWQGQTLPL
ncbi:SDR family oxidoreductase [Stutzerimonas tarimensis]|uniref:SDR family oxidoreductase n=1 Tax=Stutzerimonas tarimensis TaxID=1507735 RepID=A0ABV7SZG3_9GAMM